VFLPKERGGEADGWVAADSCFCSTRLCGQQNESTLDQFTRRRRTDVEFPAEVREWHSWRRRAARRAGSSEIRVFEAVVVNTPVPGWPAEELLEELTRAKPHVPVLIRAEEADLGKP